MNCYFLVKKSLFQFQAKYPDATGRYFFIDENAFCLFFLFCCCYCFAISPKTWISYAIRKTQSDLFLTAGFFVVLRGPLWADQPEKLALGLQRSAQNVLSPSAHVSAPLQKETEVETVSNFTCSVNKRTCLA